MAQATLETSHETERSVPAARPPALSWLATALLAAVALRVLWAWAGWLASPWQAEGVELHVLNSVFTWKAGHLPWTFLDHLPASWSTYGPLYLGLCALLPAPADNPYLTGRLISLLCLAGVACLGVLHARGRSGSWLPGLVVALLLLTVRPIFVFGMLYRVDLLAIFLSLGGFLLVTRAKRAPLFWLGILALALTPQVKLTLYAGLPAAVLYLWFHDRKRAVTVALAGGVLAALGVGWTQWATHGAYFYNVGLVAGAKARALKSLDMMTRPVTTSLFWLAALGACYANLDGEERREARPALFYTGAALGLAGLMGTHDGSSWNYLLDFYAGLALLTAGLFGALWKRGPSRPLAAVCLLLAAHAVFALWYVNDTLRPVEKGARGYARKYQRAREIIEPLLREGKRVVALRADPVQDALLRYGRFNLLGFPQERKDREIEAMLLAALQRGEVDLVLAGRNLRPWRGPGQVGPAPREQPSQETPGGRQEIRP